MLKTALVIAAIVGAAAGTIGYDASSETRTYHTDWTFAGDRVVVEQTNGRLGLAHGEKIVGHYLAGQPHVVAFGCAGHDMPLIAMDAAYLPRCERVERIEPLD